MKNTLLKAVSVLLALCAIFMAVIAITVTGSGFLDLSNIARGICVAVAIISGVLAIVPWIRSRKGE